MGQPVSMHDTIQRQYGNAEVACTEFILIRESCIMEVRRIQVAILLQINTKPSLVQ